VIVGSVYLSACSSPSTAAQLGPSSPPANHILAVELREGDNLRAAVTIGDVVAVDLHKVGVAAGDWSPAPIYFAGATGAAAQVPYPLATRQGPEDRYYAFVAKKAGVVNIGFSTTPCTGSISCPPPSSILTLVITS